MTDATPPRPARAAGLFGKLLALGLFAALAAWLVRGFLVTPVDGAAKQREYFGEVLPGGLALDSAVRLPTGDAAVRFVRASGDGASDVLFLEYRSPAAAEAEMRSQGEAGAEAAKRLEEWEAEKGFEWTALRKRDEIEWGTWRAKLVIERRFAKGGGWRDEARVDLSTPERPLVLGVRWPDEVTADETELRRLLESLRLSASGA